MKKKIIVLLSAAAILLLAVACAGCIGGDQIVGTYAHTYNDSEEFISFNSDGTYTRTSFDIYGNLKSKFEGKWQKSEDNLYTIGDEKRITGSPINQTIGPNGENVEYCGNYITRYRWGGYMNPVNYMKC